MTLTLDLSSTLSLRHEASTPVLQMGEDGGKGVRVRPPPLGATSFSAPAPTLRAWVDKSSLPSCVLRAAEALGTLEGIREQQDQLHEIQKRLEEYTRPQTRPPTSRHWARRRR